MIVTFETAKLAKDKGLFYNYRKLEGYGLFPEIDLHNKVFYNLTDQKRELLDIRIVGTPGRPEGWVFTKDYITFVNSEVSLYAPSQTELQKWLREEHNIHCDVKTLFKLGYIEVDVFRCSIVELNVDEYKFLDSTLSYEDALEAGLLEALKLIK